MKRLYGFATLVLLITVSLVWAQPGSKAAPSMISLASPGRTTWHIHGSDTTKASAGAWELTTRTAFTQLSAVDSIRVISSSTADSSYLTVYGILSGDSSLSKMNFRLSGTDSVYGPKAGYGAAKRFKYFAYAAVDTEAAGTITIVGKTSGTVTTIRPGFLETEVSHFYTGRRGAVITGWGAEVDTVGGPVEVELRFYPDFEDSRSTPETGKKVLEGPILLRTADGRRYVHHFPADARWRVGSAGYVAIFSRGSTTGTIKDSFIDWYEE